MAFLHIVAVALMLLGCLVVAANIGLALVQLALRKAIGVSTVVAAGEILFLIGAAIDFNATNAPLPVAVLLTLVLLDLAALLAGARAGRPRRRPGSAKGQVRMSSDFSDELRDFDDYRK
ncbi:MAG: hypothetical protein JST92_05450 [Deltaproteobacteria bacterium]|nr:hypothetical protein [Deltaproteobacteria bacterium]